MKTPSLRTWLSVAIVAGSLAAGGASGASPMYPADMVADLHLSYQPPCSVCHTNGVTGYGTVNTPFGKSIRARGLIAEDATGLATALMKLETDKVDSDGDSVLDVDELVMGTDPNIADKGAAPSQIGPTLAYGCGARIAPSDAAPGAWTIAIGLVALLRSRTVRRRRCRTASPGRSST